MGFGFWGFGIRVLGFWEDFGLKVFGALDLGLRAYGF